MTEPEQDPSDFTTFGDESNADRPAGHGAGSSTPKWIAALVITALVAAGVAWFVTDRSKADDLGEPVAEESVTSSTTVDPDSTGEAVDPPEEEVSWLFSLTATGGTFGANSLNPNIGTITLTGVSAETVGFTDRPSATRSRSRRTSSRRRGQRSSPIPIRTPCSSPPTATALATATCWSSRARRRTAIRSRSRSRRSRARTTARTSRA